MIDNAVIYRESCDDTDVGILSSDLNNIKLYAKSGCLS
jgi:hypothetical protein